MDLIGIVWQARILLLMLVINLKIIYSSMKDKLLFYCIKLDEVMMSVFYISTILFKFYSKITYKRLELK